MFLVNQQQFVIKKEILENSQNNDLELDDDEADGDEEEESENNGMFVVIKCW